VVARGLCGVPVVLADAHEGLTMAIAAVVVHGASWQRCRVHCVRTALALVPPSAAHLVAATMRTVLLPPAPAMARAPWRHVAESLRPRAAKRAARVEEAEADVRASLAFPAEHCRPIWSTSPLQRLNREDKRRSDVVGIFPNAAAILRLVAMVLAEQHDEWQVSRRSFSAESVAKRQPASVAQTALTLTDQPLSL
jgi:transposase-like protein